MAWRVYLKRLACVAFIVGLFAGAVDLPAAEYLGSPSNYPQLLKGLKPGDRLKLAPGTYKRRLPIHSLNGSQQAPIVIEPAEIGSVVRFVGPEGHNTISIVDSSYVTIRNLVLQGQGSEGDAVKAEGSSSCHWTHHITLEGLQIQGYGGHLQRVGISTQCPAWNWVIRNNTIVGAGTGMYLGSSSGAAPFVHGLIESNVVLDTIGYNLQIKHQRSRELGIAGMPANDGATIIRHNVFSKAAGPEGYPARPNVLVGHFPATGPGAEDWYYVYGNVFHQNPREALFQGEGNVAVYSNLFVSSFDTTFPVIAIQPHNAVPRRVRIFHNTIVARGRGISVRGGAWCCRQTTWGNMVFANKPLSGDWFSKNLTGAYESAPAYLNNPFAALGELDLYPRSGVRFESYDGGEAPERYTDADKDFNGLPHSGGPPGAYGGQGRNPGWLPAREIKRVRAPAGQTW